MARTYTDRSASLLLPTRGWNIGLNQGRLGLAWGGSIFHGLVVDGWSLMRPGALGALVLLPADSASRFNRLLTM